MTGTLVILRHGESTWNQQNLFTGWHDVPLSAKGEVEAGDAGRLMAAAGLWFDVGHTSLLTRAVDIGFHSTISQRYGPGKEAAHISVVSDGQHCLAITSERRKQAHDFIRGHRVEVAGRFVRNENRWIICQRTCNRCALLLAPRQVQR